jgi:hypothetical protein
VAGGAVCPYSLASERDRQSELTSGLSGELTFVEGHIANSYGDLYKSGRFCDFSLPAESFHAIQIPLIGMGTSKSWLRIH